MWIDVDSCSPVVKIILMLSNLYSTRVRLVSRSSRSSRGNRSASSEPPPPVSAAWNRAPTTMPIKVTPTIRKSALFEVCDQ